MLKTCLKWKKKLGKFEDNGTGLPLFQLEIQKTV